MCARTHGGLSKKMNMRGTYIARNDDDHVVLTGRDDAGRKTASKLFAHRHGLRHRAFSIFLFDDSGRFLLQRRALEKYHSGGLWSNTCCSHPRPGEGITAAARRRLREEMGLECDLVHLFETHYRAKVSKALIEDEDVAVFAGTCTTAPRPNPAEVMDFSWRQANDIERDLAENPHVYSVWFAKYWKTAFDGYRTILRAA